MYLAEAALANQRTQRQLLGIDPRRLGSRRNAQMAQHCGPLPHCTLGYALLGNPYGIQYTSAKEMTRQQAL